ncbi:MAG: hypothetical protein KTR31_03905 [Myxococcales bacterium]|nr:hypothetical protein [Myxococcales bacterium]
MRQLFGLALCVGCVGQTVPTTTIPTRVDDSETPGEPAGEGLLSGQLTTGEGTPVAGAFIELCQGYWCRTSTTDDDGFYAYDEVEDGPHSLYFVPPTDWVDPHAVSFVPLVLTDAQERVVDVPMLAVTDAVSLPTEPTELDVGGGLLLQVSAADLEPDFFEPAPDRIAALQLSDTRVLPVDGVPGEVVAMWFLDPWGASAPEGLPLRVRNQWSAPDGTSFRVWVASRSEHAWIEAGSLQASGDVLTGDARLPWLNTVVLTRDEA